MALTCQSSGSCWHPVGIPQPLHASRDLDYVIKNVLETEKVLHARAEQKGKGRKSEGLSCLRLEKSNTEITLGTKAVQKQGQRRKQRKDFQVTEEILLIQEAQYETRRARLTVSTMKHGPKRF